MVKNFIYLKFGVWRVAAQGEEAEAHVHNVTAMRISPLNVV
jgi:hypothetical protein